RVCWRAPGRGDTGTFRKNAAAETLEVSARPGARGANPSFPMPRKPQPISDAIQAKLKQTRVARLATLDPEDAPHIVPVCFAYDGRVFYSAVDLKLKRVARKKLARLQHIRHRSQVALLIDEYDEDWSQLWYIL